MEIALESSKLWRYAWWLSIGTIVYNVIEGVVSIWLGLADETLALFGFGAVSAEVAENVSVDLTVSYRRRFSSYDIFRSDGVRAAIRFVRRF